MTGEILFRGKRLGNGACDAASCYNMTDTGDCLVAGRIKCAQPDNAPLTLEALRGMDGPVWICYQQETWGPQHPGKDNLDCSAYKFPFSRYGETWLAYRRKPETEGGRNE